LTEYDFISLLKSKKVVDAFQFYTTCRFKIDSSSISYSALQRLVNEYLSNSQQERDEMFSEAISKGKASICTKSDDVDFLGVSVPRCLVIDKLTIEIFSLLHSFFDTFAQWLNAVLFAEDSLPLKEVSSYSVVRKFDSFDEYQAPFITNCKSVTDKPEYCYISDINNVMKHRYQIFTKSKFDLFEGTGNVSLPKFQKDHNTYTDKDLLQIISSCIDFCKTLLDDSYNYVVNFYKSNDNKHIEHRIYNPKTFMLFESHEDYSKLKNVKNSIHYIEVDSTNILSEYQIMLYRDDKEGETISLYNSSYSIIALRDSSSEDYVGIMKPSDQISITFDDGRILEYRKYSVSTHNYEFELFNEMVNQNFEYYPYLSDCKILIANEEL
jgi:hypothetical protein